MVEDVRRLAGRPRALLILSPPLQRRDLAACNRPLGAAPSFGFHHSPSAVFLGPTPLRIRSKSSLLSSDENLLTRRSGPAHSGP
jgi:hypothetical protein